MSLQAGDPRSRGRSKSPGGRIRERSKSRDPRLSSTAEPTSQGMGKYLASDLADAKRRARSRSRGVSPAGAYRHTTGLRYVAGPDFYQDGQEPYLRAEHGRDYYYQSDSGEGKAVRRDDRRYAPSPHHRTAHFDRDSDHSYSDSEDDDDALAYGDLPGGLERSFYGYTSTSHGKSQRHDGAMMSGALNGSPAYSSKPSRSGGGSKEDVSAFNYPAPVQYPQPQPPSSQYGVPPMSSAPQSKSNWAPIPECERPGFVPPTSQAQGQAMPGAFPLPVSSHPDVPATTAATAFASARYVTPEGLQNPYGSWNGRPVSMPVGNAYAQPVAPPTHQRTASNDAAVKPPYAAPSQYQYAHIDPNANVTYTKSAAPSAAKPLSYSAAPQYQSSGGAQANEPRQAGVKYSATPQFSKPATARPETGPQYVEITPGTRSGARPHSRSVSSAHNLAVSGPDPTQRAASPMLEPYKGTYQTISPMPSPIVVPGRYDDDVSDMELLGTSSDEGRREHRRKRSMDGKDRKESKSDRVKRDSSRVRHERHDSSGRDALVVIAPGSSRKRVTFYDAAPDAIALRDALSHTRHVDNKALIRVLPHLTGDEVLDLRKEYKKHVKVHGKGVNLAKHIRLQLENGAFAKVCYATALGRWESEAFWANCYYQSSKSRRELLIESLFGRRNSEIHEIKDCFRDSRYHDSLEKCMKAELKADKFRLAVLLALEESRQSERDPTDLDLVDRDVDELRRALITPHGGETAMIYIIVRRSDPHLRDVLRAYEKAYGRNFVRAMMEKSQNLVGETLAHILNGAINRPMRDALLLHQALHESGTSKERSELLISRLVRLHWEPRHLERVKSEFRRRYGERLEDAIAEEVLTASGGSEWGEFCIELARSSKVLIGRS
ncbi:Annexin [Aspergillus heteromorphus CBS 117.55]|uniref:Annexin n=1 Tax=Aspergillus heteromorphus CBS 117.55 TaxID=1448321 RepID=A0A317X2V4_9EURO|nr:Annexin [Aspergillus heteromorphus CBS 117.55]PWY92883.1 Annexin [Aspergillus heteromorphus CBS 117.55]